MRAVFILVGLLLFAWLQLFAALTTWESLTVALFVYFFMDFIDRLGKRVAILDLTIILAFFTWLIMPVIFYHEYPKTFRLARIWYKYMPIPSDEYFSFALPGTLMMVLGLRLPLFRSPFVTHPRLYIERVKEDLKDKRKVGIILLIIGVISGFLNIIVPAALKQVFYLLIHLTYVGVFYIIYTPENKYRKIIVPSMLVLMVAQIIVTAMFGEFIFMLSLSVILMMLGMKVSMQSKILAVAAGIFLVMIIQSVKKDYRTKAWRGEGADAGYFAELVADRVSNPGKMLDPAAMFFVAVRMNQGWLVAVTMDRVPARHPYANGETIWQSVAATLVPRFLWPDKPQAGGAANLRRFWGYNIHGYSMNIGPIGEAYGNFGRWGILYMFFYGLFFNFILSRVLKYSQKYPTLILWLPFLFMYAVGIETDLLMTMNSLIKAVFFTWIMYRGFKYFFNIDL